MEPTEAFNRLYGATDALIAAAGRIPPAVGADAEPWRKQIDAIAAAGAPRLGFGNTLELPKAATPAGLVLDNASALIAHLFKPQLIAAVEALQARKSSGPTMKPAERQKALSEAQDRIALALRMESAAATASELAGQRVIRRKHVHPAILLNLECDAADVFEWLTKKRGGA